MRGRERKCTCLRHHPFCLSWRRTLSSYRLLLGTSTSSLHDRVESTHSHNKQEEKSRTRTTDYLGIDVEHDSMQKDASFCQRVRWRTSLHVMFTMHDASKGRRSESERVEAAFPASGADAGNAHDTGRHLRLSSNSALLHPYSCHELERRQQQQQQ